MRERVQDQLIGRARAVVRLLDRGVIPLAVAVFAGFTAFAAFMDAGRGWWLNPLAGNPRR